MVLTPVLGTLLMLLTVLQCYDTRFAKFVVSFVTLRQLKTL
jgi:hypothetical protein